MMYSGKRVYLACGATDMRKSINGLSVIVESSFKMDPFGEAIFVFCNKSRSVIKILEWDTNGFWLHTKRLEKGHFKWPYEGETMSMSNEELMYLLNVPKVEQRVKRVEILTNIC